MAPTPFGADPDVPPGTIVMWNEPLAEIPSGWVLCDGANGTPNMLDRFPRGVNAGESPGTTGGNHSQNLSTSQIPNHSHNTYTDYSGSHDHTFDERDTDSDYGYRSSNSDTYRQDYGHGSVDSTKNGGHNHSASIDSTGGNSDIENRPAYHEVAYIMKS